MPSSLPSGNWDLAGAMVPCPANRERAFWLGQTKVYLPGDQNMPTVEYVDTYLSRVGKELIEPTTHIGS